MSAEDKQAIAAAFGDRCRPDDPDLQKLGVAVVGPTASGKSAVAFAVAQRLRAGGCEAELVSVDSMSVYRGMDIGTAKPSADERAAVPHHLLDVADPDEEYSVARFQADALGVLADLDRRGVVAILVGGTGLYLDAVLDDLQLPGQWPEVAAQLHAEIDTAPDEVAALGALHARLQELDPLAASRIEPGNRRRIVRALEVTLGGGRPFSSYGPGLQEARHSAARFFLAGVARSRDDLAVRIRTRYEAQMAAGFLDEVRALRDRYGEHISRTARQALGYRELLDHLGGVRSLDEALDEAVKRTVRFAKRQDRWFRRDPRITWYPASPDGNADEVVTPLLRDWDRARTSPPDR